MKCPFCNCPDTQVVDSRVSEEGDSIRRRRRCLECEKRFTTYETVELRMPQIVKSNGYREEFKEDKLRTGFMRALHRRPVPTNLVEDAIGRIKQRLLSLGEREVPSRRRDGHERTIQTRQSRLHPVCVGLQGLSGRGRFS